LSAKEEFPVLNKRLLVKAATLIIPFALLAAPSISSAETNIFGGSGLFLTHTVGVSDPGEMRLGLFGHGYEYKLPEDPKDWDLVPVFNYTPFEKTELMFSVPYRWHDDGVTTENGVGDGFLGFKYRFHAQMAALVYGSLGWGGDDLGPHSGQSDVGVVGIFSQPLGKARLDLNAGYQFSDLGDDVPGSSDRFLWGVGLSAPVMENLRIFGEWTGYGNTENSGPAPNGWTAGVIYDINNNLELTAGGGTGISGNGPASPDWRFFAGLTYSFGKKAAAPPPPAPEPPKPAPPAPKPPPAPPKPAPPAPKPPPAPPKPAPVDEGLMRIKQRLELVIVRFPYDRIEVSPEAREKLDEVAGDLKKYTSLKLTCVGHADSRGTASYNTILGQRRAKAVMEYLVSKGIDAGRLSLGSEGEMKPQASNDSHGGMVMNRRVTFSVQLP
jgi:outer membrane protein OmpA-like peptidoglycan-associated protein